VAHSLIAPDESAVLEIAPLPPTSFAAPAGTDKALTIPTHYTLHPQDFGFSDADGNAFQAVTIATLATTGTLYYDSNGSLGGGRSAVTAGQVVTVKDILAGKLSFVSSGTSGSSFTFQAARAISTLAPTR
jgi:hypothetical protein